MISEPIAKDKSTIAAGRPEMDPRKLDEIVLEVVATNKGPMTVRQIELQVNLREIPADTYDVQRSVRRLVKDDRLTLTPQLDIAKAS